MIYYIKQLKELIMIKKLEINPDNLSQCIEILESGFGYLYGRVYNSTASRAKLFASLLHASNIIVFEENSIIKGLLIYKTHKQYGYKPAPLSAYTANFGAIKGTLSMLFTKATSHKTTPNEVYIQMLGVHPEHRSCGIASQLINFIQQEFIVNDNLNTLSLDVINTNHTAQALYTKLGFVTQKTTNFYPLNKLLKMPCESADYKTKPIK